MRSRCSASSPACVCVADDDENDDDVLKKKKTVVPASNDKKAKVISFAPVCALRQIRESREHQ